MERFCDGFILVYVTPPAKIFPSSITTYLSLVKVTKKQVPLAARSRLDFPLRPARLNREPIAASDSLKRLPARGMLYSSSASMSLRTISSTGSSMRHPPMAWNGERGGSTALGEEFGSFEALVRPTLEFPNYAYEDMVSFDDDSYERYLDFVMEMSSEVTPSGPGTRWMISSCCWRSAARMPSASNGGIAGLFISSSAGKTCGTAGSTAPIARCIRADVNLTATLKKRAARRPAA